MNQKKIKNYLYVNLMVVISIFVLVFIFYVFGYLNALPKRTFNVTSEAKVSVIPDIGEITVGVLTEGDKDLVNLQKENAEKINKIISFLKVQSIEEKDIKTTNYSISPRYQYFSCLETSKVCPPPEIVGYSLSQNLVIKVRNLELLGSILKGVVSNGANNVSGPYFVVDEIERYQEKAREEAIKKAFEKAKNIAKAANFKLGKLINIQELNETPIYPLRQSFEVGGSGGDLSFKEPTLPAGSQEIKVSVILTYEIK